MIRGVAKVVAGTAMATALVGGMAGPASAQQVCLPYRYGFTVTLVGQDYEIPGHGVGCKSVPDVDPPNVYDDDGTIVVSTNPYGDRLCLVGVEGNCLLALES